MARPQPAPVEVSGLRGHQQQHVIKQNVCYICYETRTPDEMQELNCKHVFCISCLAECVSIDDNPMNVSMYGKIPAILDIEEKFRCEARRGQFMCSGFARVAMQDCRHRICFDCLAQRVQYASKHNEIPNCAHPRCANRLTRTEVMRIAEKFPNMKNECKEIVARMPEEQCEDESKSEDIILVTCSIFQRPYTARKLSIPRKCPVVYMLSAMMQLQRLSRAHSISSLSIYVNREKEQDKAKYEIVVTKGLGNKTVKVRSHFALKIMKKDMEFPEKAHFIFDLDNVLAKRV